MGKISMAHSQRKPIAVHGEFVRSATVGCLVFIETRDVDGRGRLYASHRDWICALDPISIARARTAWAHGAVTLEELAELLATTDTTIWRCVRGLGEYRYLAPVARGSAAPSSAMPVSFSLSYGAASARVASQGAHP
jgi:hypothetical protein